MNLITDDNGVNIQGFSPNRGKTYSGEVIVTKPTAIMLGSDVAISIDGKVVSYSEGSGLILAPKVIYTFISSVDCHVMD